MPATKSQKDVILVIEDEPDVLDLLRLHLRKEGYAVLEASDGVSGLTTARQKLPAAIVLDLMIPDLRGEDVCRQLREQESTARIPIIMLTAKARPEERIAGLELGADDYLTKPFSPRELILRLGLLIQRSRSSGEGETLRVGPFELDRGAFEVRLKGRKLDLTGLEFKLLATLMENRGKALSRETLLRDVWGYRNLSNSRTVDTHVRRLRAKLKPHEERLRTIHGEGYMLLADETD
ncbi:MAG: response regulator transcription factor [Chthoniobacterales bacterium]|jgi:two-component system phosphate regulon response regulator PhoB